jgi:hypothetical protein
MCKDPGPVVAVPYAQEAVTSLGPENSEVLPPGPVAVAVIVCPASIAFVGEKVEFALPFELVLTVVCPLKTFPSLPRRWRRTGS